MKKTAFLCALLTVLTGYIFGLHDGFVGYCTENGIWTLTDVPSHAVCTQADRAALSKGIYLETEQALSRALEDFCS